MKFEIENTSKGYTLCEKFSDLLIILGNIDISKKESKHLSCYRQKDYFYYHGIQHALCGKTNDFGFVYFTPKRILVIQMQ